MVLIAVPCLRAASPIISDILPRSAVAGGAQVAHTGVYVPWGNPAAAAFDTAVVLQVGYENRYFAPELSDEYCSATIPTPYFNISVSYNFFGLAAYHEMMAAFSVSRKWGIVALGVEVDYFNYYDASAARYHHAVSAQVGVDVAVSSQVMLGFRAFNPTFSQIKQHGVVRSLPTIFDVGVSYRPQRQLVAMATIGYVPSVGVRWAVGAEYTMLDAVVAKVGASGADYVVPMLGAGVVVGSWRFDLAAEADFRVGISLMSNFQYRF